MSLNKPIVQPEPFAPVAELERQVAELAALSAALVEDQTSLCNLLADKTRQIALLEQRLATLQRQRGTYRIHSQPAEVTGRYLTQRR